jgi:hypothetical protein
MSKQFYYLSIAEKMWDGELPQDLVEILNGINELCIKAGGILASRQTIACVIEQYKRKG